MPEETGNTKNNDLELLAGHFKKSLYEINRSISELKRNLTSKSHLYFNKYEIYTRNLRGMTEIISCYNFVERYKNLCLDYQKKTR